MFPLNQPALFVPHGAPTFALRPGAAGAALERKARRLGLSRAIVVVSPHWDTSVPTVGMAARPETIHDFHGFPDELYRIRYPATGCPEVAREVGAALEAAGLEVEYDTGRGLDHGAWVPLRMMFPDAEVPIVPLSVQSRGGPAHALRVGRALAPLRERGLLVLATGSLTHNLADFVTALRGDGSTPAYVREFADWVWDRVAAGDVAGLLGYRGSLAAASRAHPTEEHLLPLFVALGAGGEPFAAERFHAGIDDFVIAMDAFSFSGPEEAKP